MTKTRIFLFGDPIVHKRMAESLHRPPGELDIIEGNVSENFKRWKRQFEIYLTASGAVEKSQETQTAILLQCAGAKVIEIYDHFVWAENGDKNKPDAVMQKIEEHCNPRRNEVLESHRFWSVSYQSAQGFKQFLTVQGWISVILPRRIE